MGSTMGRFNNLRSCFDSSCLSQWYHRIRLYWWWYFDLCAATLECNAADTGNNTPSRLNLQTRDRPVIMVSMYDNLRSCSDISCLSQWYHRIRLYWWCYFDLCAATLECNAADTGHNTPSRLKLKHGTDLSLWFP